MCVKIVQTNSTMSENIKCGSRPPTKRDSCSDTLFAPRWRTLRDRAVPQPDLLHRFTDISPQLTIDLDIGEQIALLVTPEYEGLFRNGGIGTYYTTLSHKLADRGWSIVLLLYQTEECFGGGAIGSAVRHAFSTAEVDRILDLAPVQTARLAQFQPGDWVEDSSYRSLLFAQALNDRYPDAQIYIEFPDLCGVGLQTIRAKRAGLLGRNCVTAVTLHSTQEWLNEAHDRFSLADSDWFRRVYEYEREAFETADIAFFLSYFLKAKVESYGWKNDSRSETLRERAIHLPYCFEIVESNPSSIAPLDIPRHVIPIVFFGRLEERKGLLTFIAAVRQLDPSWRDRLHLIFLGKSVTLHVPDGPSLTSREYIDRELGQDFTYTIETDRFSQEAIALVRQLAPAIVTLASPQENLPNTAFEMGQLPVSLVVSDTGGFLEPLNLMRRFFCADAAPTAGVRWFVPGSADGLARSLAEAIAAYPELPNVPKTETLEDLNRSLLDLRLEVMRQARSTDPSRVDLSITRVDPQLPFLLGMTSTSEQSFLRQYARDDYTGQGEIVDLGCWLGSSTISLAQGLEANSRVRHKSKRIHAYDLFIWYSIGIDSVISGTDLDGKYQDGDCFLDEFLVRTQPWFPYIATHSGNLLDIDRPPHQEIECLFVDAMKSWDLAKNIIKHFYIALIPGLSIVHHNDFAHFYTGWIHLLMYKLRSHFEHIGNFYDAAAFKYVKPFDSPPFQGLDMDAPLSIFSKTDIDDAFAYSSEIGSDFMQPNIAAAKSMFWLHLGNIEAAKQELERARERFGDIRDIVSVMPFIEEISKREEYNQDLKKSRGWSGFKSKLTRRLKSIYLRL